MQRRHAVSLRRVDIYSFAQENSHGVLVVPHHRVRQARVIGRNSLEMGCHCHRKHQATNSESLAEHGSYPTSGRLGPDMFELKEEQKVIGNLQSAPEYQWPAESGHTQ